MRRLLLTTVVVLFLVGCSAEQQSEPGAMNEETLEMELQTWAGDLCSATDQLERSVIGITQSLDLDLSAGLDQLPQIYTELQASIGEVDAQVTAVESVLAEVPSSPQAEILAAEIQALVVSARSSGDEALGLAAQAVESGNFLEAGVAAAGALAAARNAYDDASQALALVDGASRRSDGPVGQAFEAAPECQTT